MNPFTHSNEPSVFLWVSLKTRRKGLGNTSARVFQTGVSKAWDSRLCSVYCCINLALRETFLPNDRGTGVLCLTLPQSASGIHTCNGMVQALHSIKVCAFLGSEGMIKVMLNTYFPSFACVTICGLSIL